jgi:hypothetical protein
VYVFIQIPTDINQNLKFSRNHEFQLRRKVMELLQESSPIVDLYTVLNVPIRFTLVDVGCSGGIDPVFLCLGSKLRALGIDASIDEIEKLRKKNINHNVVESPEGQTGSYPNKPVGDGGGVYYVDGLVGLPPDHPFCKELYNQSYVRNNPWNRLSASASTVIRKNKNRYSDHAAKMQDNLWQETRLSGRSVVLSDIMAEYGFYDVDFLKIDIDGPDFMALQALDGRFEEFGILAVCMEVNYCGSDAPTDHTFHNTDRFMRKNGFDLFGLTVRPYSMVSLPSRFQWGSPGPTITGKPFQGDALYVRDICVQRAAINTASINIKPEKIINTIVLFSLFGLPDCAAEVILTYKNVLDPYLDSAVWLNALTQQCLQLQDMTPKDISTYGELMEKYNNDDPDFYFGASDFKSIRPFLFRLKRYLQRLVKR